MSIIVQKFGGTSVKDIKRIQYVAQTISKEIETGKKVVVVVSAMGKTTNNLIELIESLDKNYVPHEYDVVLSTGEQVSAGLLSIALNKIGITSKTLLGWQIPLLTDENYNTAKIIDIDVRVIRKKLQEIDVLVIPGFQGVTEQKQITTLGRGGSDTTAVAVAAKLKAERCDIFTDVEGVFTTDPNIEPKARKLDKITFEEMIEMSSAGAKVLETRSVAIAMNYDLKLQVLSSFLNKPGTFVVSEEKMEKQKISGIAYSINEAKITLASLPDRPGVAALIFENLANHDINVDMIVQSASSNNTRTDITFSLPKNDLNKAINSLKSLKEKLDFSTILHETNISKISIIGTAMRTRPGIAKKMFSILAEKGINLHVISTSEIKISVLIDSDYTELAVRNLHEAFGLDKK